MKKLYSYEVKSKAERFLNCNSLEDMSRLGLDTSKMALLSLKPPYYSFQIKKKSGGFRQIEAPELHLKTIQSQLNRFLQCVYFIIQTKAAYGFIISVKDIRPNKNILENARQHLGAKYLINADFKNFFHQISDKMLLQLFQKAPFNFPKKLAYLLTGLMSRQGRLPMGAPTSPVLSNLMTIDLDKALRNWSESQQITYTRFVDDLTFSSKERKLNYSDFESIECIAQSHGFHFNPNKVKFFDEHKTKKVTGLLLKETVDIDPPFYRELDKQIKRLKSIAEAGLIIHQHKKTQLLDDFKKEVEGMINFIGMIEGYNSPIYIKYRKRITRALDPHDDVLSVRWTNSNYF